MTLTLTLTLGWWLIAPAALVGVGLYLWRITYLAEKHGAARSLKPMPATDVLGLCGMSAIVAALLCVLTRWLP